MNFGHVVVDEAQDFSEGFYKSLAMLSAVDQITVTVVADENQRLEESKNSSLEEIEGGLRVGGVVQKFPLTKNYRNTLEIDALSRRFYVGLPTGQAEPPHDRLGTMPLLCGYAGGTNAMVEAIVRHATNNSKPVHSRHLPDDTPAWFNLQQDQAPHRWASCGGVHQSW